MKKAFVTLCVIMMTAVTAFAGSGETTRYYAPKGTQGWFIDLAGTYSIMASTGSAYHHITTYYGGFYQGNLAQQQHQFGFSAKVGRRVSPSIAVRAGYDRHLGSNMNGNDFMFKSYHLDVMESPLDFFFGYNPDRLYTMWIYGGVGMLAWDPMATHKYNILIHVFDGKSDIELGFHGGIMNNFRLSNSLDLHFDLTAVATKWTFDTDTYDTYTQWHRAHFDFSGMVGLMWYLGGRRFEAVPECPECPECPETGDCSKQEATINDLNGRIAKLQSDLDACLKNGGVLPGDTIYTEGKLVTYPFSIFFNKGSYELRDGRDRINLQEIAQAAINHNLKVNLRGTCDSATASAAFNKTLAENRCNKVKNELVKIGVPANNITIEAVGGVSELKPTEYDRRVLITFSK
jgi:outer membrane protein OmpA-like peptidoglycan-associated protein